ncbi:MAG TPA: DUF1080 domain-containing protein [Prolixibacteraceae bacterium]|nr:MAG: hypothetical protein BWX87_01565 [Bacteroidetes bacterium ADurb.Bin123]HPV17780.1 DUF1080 domain-containing protein [Prolixibacteraceae bacterium]
MKKFLLLSLVLLCAVTTNARKEGGWEKLFNGKDLKGWKQLNGTAKYEVVRGEIVGTTVFGTPNSFLVTEKEYGDFILELDLLVGSDMNSGIQFRSESKADYLDGRVHGYQCEVDPSPRAWSGGIYDEARRGWLYTNDLNPASKTAFKAGGWNHFRIECIGNSIRTWLNGIPVAWVIDDMTPQGFIALQVHAINTKEEEGRKIRWKNIRIKTRNLQPAPFDDITVVNLIPNNLSEPEKKQGFRLLFDGKTSNGWNRANGEAFPEKGWTVDNGSLVVLSSAVEKQRGGDIVTNQKFRAFELKFDFNLAPGANSGIKYGTGNNGPSIGLEYQILDDERHPDAKMGVVGNRTLASLYDLIPAEKEARFVNKPGEWNRGTIVLCPDNRVEHWLNGRKVVEYTRGNNIYRALVARSKYVEFENFGMTPETPILLQDHGDHVMFRSIKIREL